MRDGSPSVRGTAAVGSAPGQGEDALVPRRPRVAGDERGALVDEQDRYLVEQYSLTYLTTGRDLLRMQSRSQSAKGAKNNVIAPTSARRADRH